MPNPTCSTNCEADLPISNFSDCNPIAPFSEVRRIFIAKLNAQPFNNWLNAAEWNARISPTNVGGNDYIRALTVIAEKPAATAVIRELSNGRRKVIGKDHVLNFTIDDVSDENYEFMRALECGGRFRYWYETEGGYIYGGNTGFVANVDANDVLNRGREETETINGVLSWRSKFHPERGVSPIYNGDNGGAPAPVTFDTELDFSASATPAAVAGVEAVASATDPEQLFEFNAISPRVGAPIDFQISVGGTPELTVTATADYVGNYFRYTDKAGVEHTGQFTNSVDIDF